MQRCKVLLPGRIRVHFRRGPSGHLRQDPSHEAANIKRNPSLQDKFCPLREEAVKAKAYNVVSQRGGDVSYKQEVLGEYVLQFGKYKEGNNHVGFGVRAKNTWQAIWDSRADGYAAFILGKNCVKNSQMYKLQHTQQGTEPMPSTAPPAVLPPNTPAISKLSSGSSG
ncbi:hypothetical protein SKAU_G00057960 [Synaphobranchus kaupii]|uniref:Uncharacterized protein n=1 Tax=Synaphobranchus kaupii TaxID=118154 RepID=A0A9Q1G559_SYNKA|nr:hypothetical protein SKAU_G00057960 [Synaphobranchus kaupii]